MNVQAEVDKHKNVNDRDELGRIIKDYKGLALQHAGDMILAGQYNLVALKLQERYDKMPAPRMKGIPTGSTSAPTKTAKISKDEKAKINAAWSRKTGNTKK